MNDTFILDNARTLRRPRAAHEVPRRRARPDRNRRGAPLRAGRRSEADIVRSLAYLAEQTEAVRELSSRNPSRAKDAPAPDPQLDALASLCQILLSSNRFLYVD